MHSQSTAAAFGQHLEVSARLRSFDHAERVVLPGYGKIGCVIARNLQEDARIRTTLVGLTGRMQKAGTESEACRDAFLVSQHMANSLQARLVFGVHLDEGEQSKVIACAETIEMRTKITCKRF